MSLSSLKLSEMVKILLLKGRQMSSCQDLLPGFLPSCVPGEQFPFCSLVCRFSAECTVFTAGDQILISILLCSPFAFPAASNPKTISAPLRGDGFWEKLFGLSSLTKTWKRYLFYLISAFHPQHRSGQTPACKMLLTLLIQKSILFIYLLWLRAAAKKKILPCIFSDSKHLFCFPLPQRKCAI